MTSDRLIAKIFQSFITISLFSRNGIASSDRDLAEQVCLEITQTWKTSINTARKTTLRKQIQGSKAFQKTK